MAKELFRLTLQRVEQAARYTRSALHVANTQYTWDVLEPPAVRTASDPMRALPVGTYKLYMRYDADSGLILPTLQAVGGYPRLTLRTPHEAVPLDAPFFSKWPRWASMYVGREENGRFVGDAAALEQLLNVVSTAVMCRYQPVLVVRTRE